uniref:Nucleoporin_N domain-containing protein n=1 Tax=Gongylonema pulchrum TaxID=637853 RepID=A0A183EFR5_9BILA
LQVAVVQCGLKKVSLINLRSAEQQQVIQLPITLKGLNVGEKYIAFWDEHQVALYEIVSATTASLQMQPATSFACSVSCAAVYQQGVCCIEADKLNFRTFQGTVKQTISMPEMEGDPMMLDINGSWMCVTNSNGFIRIYDLSAR